MPTKNSQPDTTHAFDDAHQRVCELIDRFERYAKTKYLLPSYQEAEARKDFIDPLLKALGWDVDHEQQHNPYEQEVKVESGLMVHNARAQKRADYAFYLNPNFRDVRFYVEAKKPSVDLANSVDAHFQTLRYGYSAGTPLAILTDFEQIRVLDCRARPHPDTALSQVYKAWHYTELRDREAFAWFYWLFSREAHATGAYQRHVEDLPKAKGGSRQRGLFKGGYQPVDESFLMELAEYRETLAKAFKKADTSLDSSELTELVQNTIDRLVFMRFLEDKQIETELHVSTLGQRKNAWADFQTTCHRLDAIYNGIVFKPLPRLDDPKFMVDADVFADICERISSENSPYNFDAIPIHILGSIYERFLGSIIRATDKQAKVEEKPEVRKAGGVYYTPEYIVRYIVSQSVGRVIAGKTPAEIREMHFIDIACGSGSFLLGVYSELLHYHADWYNRPGRERQAKKDGCIRTDSGRWRLSLAQRRSILQNNIFGVDLDRQAVEVAQLSLFLKLLEEEGASSARQYQLEFARDNNMKKLLPDLSENILCGNSLVGWGTATMLGLDTEQESQLNPLDFQSAFPHIMRGGGFDAVIGNPPYLNIDDTWGKGDFRLAAIKAAYPAIYNDKTDLLYYFLARASQLSRGTVGFIVSRAFIEAFKADKLRAWLLKSTAIRSIIDFRNTIIFKGVGITTAIIDLDVGAQEGLIRVHQHREANAPEPPLAAALNDPAQFETFEVAQSRLRDTPWSLTNSDTEALNAKIDAAGRSLGSILEIGQGMQTGLNSVFAGRSEEEMRAWRIPEAKRFRRATNTDIQRYHIEDRGEYLLCTHLYDKLSDLPSGVKDHLQAHASELKKRAAFQRGNCEWWQFTWPLHAELYGVRKRILCPYLAKENRFALDEADAFIGLTDTTVCFDNDQPEDLHYLLGLLNSRLLTFRFRSIGKLKSGGVYEYFWNSISRLPICRIDFKCKPEKTVHDRIVTLVKQRIQAGQQAATSTGHAARVAERKAEAIDTQIDALVYELYGLTNSEIAAVESALGV